MTGVMSENRSAGDEGQRRVLRICIVTSGVVGPETSSGIATAYTALAQALAEAGHDVTVLYAGQASAGTGLLGRWIDYYARQSIRLVPLPGSAVSLSMPNYAKASYMVYGWLKDHEKQFDLVHYHEWQAPGYYAAVAKHQGIAFAGCTFCAGIHSPTSFVKESEGSFISSPRDIALDLMERRSVAFADVAWTPSQYMIKWLGEHSWELPKQHFVRQNVMPRSVRGGCDTGSGGATGTLFPVEELVYFGRLQRLKGIDIFCDAVDLLAREGTRPRRVSFLGRACFIDGRHASDYVRERAKAWPFPCRIVTKFNQMEALRYLQGGRRLAVVPSRGETSPYVVLECLGGGVPFLASRVGGIPELICAEDHDKVLFDPTPQSLAAKLRLAVLEGPATARPAVPADETRKAWLDWHSDVVGAPRPPQPTEARNVTQNPPLVSVCIPHHNRHVFLRQALESIRNQDYPNVEVIVVDDGSTDPESLRALDDLETQFAPRGWRLVRQENRYLGAARNAAARHANGEYLLFLDDDDYAKPSEISMLMKVAGKTGASIVTGGVDCFKGPNVPSPDQLPDYRWIPIGPFPVLGAFMDCFGAAGALVRRKDFHAIGGYTEDYGVGHEDWEFFARAVLRGYHMELVPEPIYWYRVGDDSMIRTTSKYANHMRSLRPYLEAVPKELRDLVLYAQGSYLNSDPGDLYRQSYEYIMNKPVVRAYRWVKQAVIRLARFLSGRRGP